MLMRNDSQLKGLNVLVVEDETLVLFNLEDTLTELGCIIVGPAMRLHQAESLVASASEIDVAILDVNLGGVPVFPIAEQLRLRGIRLIFATGYGREGLPEEWRSYPVLMKPYMGEEVTRVLQEVVRGG
jgi:DNA-binding NarL/FixJ family response regulator